MKLRPGARIALVSLVALFGVCALSAGSRAQQPVDEGFDVTLEATASSEELNAQDDLWVMEVSFKPMRMIDVEVRDPKTGQRKKEYIWYLIYKAVNRPLEGRTEPVIPEPVNQTDPVPTPTFVPEFTLVTEDNDVPQIYPDVFIPEAQRVIQQREHRQPTDPVYKNSVEIVGDIPEITPYESRDEKALYGMVMFRGVDSDTDYFTVYMTGFTSFYRKMEGPDGEPLIVRRVIKQQYWRPGDRYDQTEREIRRKGEPQWIERPDEPTRKPAPSRTEIPQN